MKGDGEQRATRGRADVWEGASLGAQVELLSSRGIRATLGASGPQVDLAAAGLCVLVATGRAGVLSLEKLVGQHGALPGAPRWLDGDRRLALFRASGTIPDAVNMHGAVAGVSVLVSGVLALPPSAPVGSTELRWSPKDHPAVTVLNDIPPWIVRMASDPIEAHRAWDTITGHKSGKVEVLSEWEKELTRSRGRVLGTHGNLCKILRGAPPFAGRFRLNQLNQHVEFEGRALPEGEIGALRERIEDQATWGGFSPSEPGLMAAVRTVAWERRYHPVQEYLAGLKWDGVSRIDSVAGAILSAKSSALVDKQVRRWFVSAVRRALIPGCQVDTALVLVGDQGRRKSSFFRSLADPWFADTEVQIGDKDGMQQIQSAWITEWGEIDHITGARHAGQVKQFLSRRTDLFRPPYGRTAENFPRSCVIVGSTNRTEFLTDPTGSRRFWVVEVTDRIDLDQLARWRDQLWAEAVVLARDTAERHWFEPVEDVEREVAAKRFRVRDPWEEIVDGWVTDRWPGLQASTGRKWLTTWEVLSSALGHSAREASRAAENRVGEVMGELGYVTKRVRLKRPEVGLFRDKKGEVCRFVRAWLTAEQIQGLTVEGEELVETEAAEQLPDDFPMESV